MSPTHQWHNAQYRATIAAAALEVISEAFNVPLARLATASRQQANVAFARQMAMYLCHVVGELSIREIAIEFAREPSTVSHACHAIEDRRDIDVFDRQLTVLEEALRERLQARLTPPGLAMTANDEALGGTLENKSVDGMEGYVPLKAGYS
ncbi:MAG: helix-turn-helix domain-containing protein [Pseudomonadota bacterium]